jgi:hydroxymethylpyrimidine pyrophosphatase-like HAD family hydrolase
VSRFEPSSLTEHPSIVAIDLDGTLLNSTKALNDRSRRAVEGLIEQDPRVAIATARPGCAVAKLLGPPHL